MYGKIKPIWYIPLKHIYKLIFDNNYRQISSLYSKYAKYPRFKEQTISFSIAKSSQGGDVCCQNNYKFAVPDVASFLSTYEELFYKEIYKFKSNSEKSVIIDIGANIGLSILAFATMYPSAQIEAYEADPKIFRYLSKNTKQIQEKCKDSNIEIINKAVWNENTTLKFDSEGADGGRVADIGINEVISVEAIDVDLILAKYKHIDLLKIDIEGAERVVFPRCQKHLHKIDHIFLEYHSEADQEQCLHEMINILIQSGFRVKIESINNTKHPLIRNKQQNVFDLQLNIFAIRQE